MKLNRKRSQELGKAVGAKNNECFYNSFKALSLLPGASYVEGWAVCRDLPIPLEHGWLELDGEIIDTTPAWRDSENTYFPGVRYTLEEALRLAENNRMLPLVYRGGYSGLHDSEYLTAHNAAWSQVCPLD